MSIPSDEACAPIKPEDNNVAPHAEASDTTLLILLAAVAMLLLVCIAFILVAS